MGGVGKTALALRLGHELKPSFPDADFYLDLRGAAVAPNRSIPPEEALQHVIRAFTSPGATLPADLAELQALYRSCLAGKRAIVFWDNAKDAEHVKDLIPPAGCLMLITSRARFQLPAMNVMHVDAFPEGDAVAFLKAIAMSGGRTLGDADAVEIARLCGHLPQALRLAGGGLAARPDLLPPELIGRLHELEQRLRVLDRYKNDTIERSLQASMEMTQQLLPEQGRAKWHALAVLPATFDFWAAVWVWGEPGDSSESELKASRDCAADILSDLVRLNAVVYEESTKRFRLHDLTRAFCLGLLKGDDQERADRGFCEYYATIAHQAGELFGQDGGQATAMLYFDVEGFNFIVAHSRALVYAKAKGWAMEVVKAFAASCNSFVSMRLHPVTRLEWCQAGLDAAKSTNDQKTEAAILSSVAIAYARLGSPLEALASLMRALEIVKQIGERHNECIILGNIGSVYLGQGNAEKCIEYCKAALALGEELGGDGPDPTVLGNIGLAYIEQGRTQAAIDCMEQQLTILRRGDKTYAVGPVLINLGWAYSNAGDAKKAIECTNDGLAVVLEYGDEYSQSKAIGNLGLFAARSGKSDEAIRYFQQQIELARKIGDKSGEANGYWNMGLEFARTMRVSQAAECMQKRVDYRRQIGHPAAAQDAAIVASLGSPRIVLATNGSEVGGSIICPPLDVLLSPPPRQL